MAVSDTRRRIQIAIALVVVIAIGLATRSSRIPWPAFVAQNFGDALWTVAVYLSLAFVFVKRPAWQLALTALVISYVVECAQLLTMPWLVSLRATLPGRLLLGSGFVWADFPRYTAGALLGFGLDVGLLRRR